ncbi:hypothetical protein, partial [Microbispora sp. NPDC049633]|uniref:hypothetical protein n=1 Tax=Microbispora sp. NPDC049633 TaxID=3154355 RepID=UPI00343C32C6
MGEGRAGVDTGEPAGTGAAVRERRAVGRAVTVLVGAGRVVPGPAVDGRAWGRAGETGDAVRDGSAVRPGEAAADGDGAPPAAG